MKGCYWALFHLVLFPYWTFCFASCYPPLNHPDCITVTFLTRVLSVNIQDSMFSFNNKVIVSNMCDLKSAEFFVTGSVAPNVILSNIQISLLFFSPPRTVQRNNVWEGSIIFNSGITLELQTLSSHDSTVRHHSRTTAQCNTHLNCDIMVGLILCAMK